MSNTLKVILNNSYLDAKRIKLEHLFVGQVAE